MESSCSFQCCECNGGLEQPSNGGTELRFFWVDRQDFLTTLGGHRRAEGRE